MASRRASIAEDLESGAEFERIKQNFRSTVVAPDVPADFPEAQAAFQELQDELQDFLSQHIPKVASLQGLISSNLTSGGSGATHESHNQVTTRPNRMTRTSLHVPVDGDSPETAVDPLTDPVSRHSSLNRGRMPQVDNHMQALQAFLSTHLENIRALQMSVLSTSMDSHTKHANIPPSKAPLPLVFDREKQQEDITQQLQSIVSISTITAVLIVVLLILSAILVGGRRQTAFNIGMLFAFFALSFHFGNIVIGSRGTGLLFYQAITHETTKAEHDEAYFKFFLTVSQQLQVVATAFLIISTIIMAFIIFDSMAFPFLFLFLSAIGAIIVFVSAYFKVLITIENLVFLAKNTHRLGWRVLDYVKTPVDMRRPPIP